MRVCLLVQHLHRQQGGQARLHRWGAAASDRPPPATAAQGRLRTFEVMGQKPKLQMHAGRLGAGGGRGGGCGEDGAEEDRGEAARRLRSGSRAKRGEAGSSYRAQNKSLWTGLRRKESVGGNQRTKQAACVPTPVGHYLFCMTNRRKTIPEQHRALDTTRGTEGRAGVRGGAGAGSAGFVQGGTKDTRLPVLGNLCPLECGALGLGVLYCSPSSLGWVPGWRGWLGAALPQPLPPRATRRWRSTVCSASVLRRRWEDAAGSRGGPGPAP